MLSHEQIAFLESRRVARLATADAQRTPHVVTVCFAYLDGCVYTPLDAKPKSVESRRLRRVRNILENPEVAIMADRYSEDWSRLGYVLIRGSASLIEPEDSEHPDAVEALRAKYMQYREMPLHEQLLIRVKPRSSHSWGKLDSRDRSVLDFMDLIRGRRSVRRYTAEPVEPELVRTVLEAGRWAPSPHGSQPWRFAVLTAEERKRELADAMAATWRLQLRMDGQDEAVVETRLRKSRDRLMNAPVLVVVCLYLEDLDRYPDADRQVAETTMAVQSLGAAAQNMLLTAYELGMDGGWMCAPLFCPETVRDVLGLRGSLIPHAILTFGYAAADPVRRARRPLDDLIELYE